MDMHYEARAVAYGPSPQIIPVSLQNQDLVQTLDKN